MGDENTEKRLPKQKIAFDLQKIAKKRAKRFCMLQKLCNFAPQFS